MKFPSPRFKKGLLNISGGEKPDSRTQFEIQNLQSQEGQSLTLGRFPVGLIRSLPWESRIFEIPCHQLDLGLHQDHSEKLRDLTKIITLPGVFWTKISSDHKEIIQVLKKTGFDPILEMINLEWIPDPQEIQKFKEQLSPFFQILLSQKKDIPSLKRIAKHVFIHDRYHRDPRLSKIKANQAHEEWIQNSVLKKTAEGTLHASIQKEAAGFHAFKTVQFRNQKIGMTVLIGVQSRFSGRGIGKSLLKAGILKMWSQGARRFWVRTEARNTPANQLYLSLGFQITSRFWYLRKFNP